MARFFFIAALTAFLSIAVVHAQDDRSRAIEAARNEFVELR